MIPKHQRPLLVLGAACLAIGTVLGWIVTVETAHPHAAAPSGTDARDALLAEYHPSNETDTIRVSAHAAQPGATIHFLVTVPGADSAASASEWNMTDGTTRDLDLHAYPRLFILRAIVHEPGEPTLQKWIWQGHAHVLVADTPAQLAAQLAQEDP